MDTKMILNDDKSSAMDIEDDNEWEDEEENKEN